MKLQSILGACAALLILSPIAAQASTLTFTIDSLSTLQITGYSASLMDITNISPGDWDVSFSGSSLNIYSGEHLSFASPDYGGSGAVVFITDGPTVGNSLNIQVTTSASVKTSLDYCGFSSPIPDGSTCGIGYTTPGYAVDNGIVEEVPSVATTPEPSSLLLLGTGLLSMAGAARRRFV